MIGVWRAIGRSAQVGTVVLIVTAGLLLGGWRAGWWFAGQNAANQAHLIRNGYSNQQSLREQITQQIANVDAETVSIAAASGNPAEVSALKSQRIAVVNIVCMDASEVVGDPLALEQRQWIGKNCLAGSIRPGSPYTR